MPYYTVHSWSISAPRIEAYEGGQSLVIPSLDWTTHRGRLVKCTFQLEHNRFPGNCRKAGRAPLKLRTQLGRSFPFSSPRGWLRGSWSNLPISLFHFTSPFSSLSPPQPTMGHKISMNERRKHTHSLTRQLSRGGVGRRGKPFHFHNCRQSACFHISVVGRNFVYHDRQQ